MIGSALAALALFTACGSDPNDVADGRQKPKAAEATADTAAAETTIAAAAPTTAAPTTTVASGDAVSIGNFAFGPAVLHVKVGDSVTWTNADTRSHQLASVDGSVSSNEVKPGQTVTIRFGEAGTHQYFDAIYNSMTGTIEVG